jgi:hypothetical protein
VRDYYGAPLPDYLYTKYENELTEDDKQRFMNHLSGTGNTFIGRGAPKSATATHLLHLKALKNPRDILRYVKGVVFPGKEFMIQKYNISDKRLVISDKFWWLWYPYRYYCGLKGFWYVVTGNTEKRKEK